MGAGLVDKFEGFIEVLRDVVGFLVLGGQEEVAGKFGGGVGEEGSSCDGEDCLNVGF
jgi:hypothetical protein